jgi:aspartate-semialdehyde dehydrogenase
MTRLRISVVGASSLAGIQLLSLLRRSAHWSECETLAFGSSASSEPKTLVLNGSALEVTPLDVEQVRSSHLVFLCTPAEISRLLVPHLLQTRAQMIDLSSAYRQDPLFPLVIPEINGHLLTGKEPLVANPNCTTAILLMGVLPLRTVAGLEEIICASYQSVSGAGGAAMVQFESEKQNLRVSSPVLLPHIVDNLIPVIGPVDRTGWSEEEAKVRDESRKILDDATLAVRAMCVRVPTPRCHAVAAFVRTRSDPSENEVLSAYEETPGVRVTEALQSLQQAAGVPEVFVSRLRREGPGEWTLWAVGDNLLKGAASNALQIAEILLARRGVLV